jgi:hypothetical protein
MDDVKPWQVDYLKTTYQERSRAIRDYLTYIDRSTTWGVGALLGGAGYLATNVPQIPFQGKILLSAATLLFMGSMVFSILRAVRDLKSCSREIAKMDTLFLAFEPGAYIPGSTLLPREWKEWGQPSWSEKHLWIPPLIMYSLAGLIVILSIWRMT